MPLSNKNGSSANCNNNTYPPKKRNARTPEEELERQIIQKLASRSYHLPGYKLFRDWAQYLFNNHPVLGICFHHKLHPLKMRQRLIILLGSFFYGVAITNVIYLWFLGTGRDDQEEVFALDLSANGQEEEQSYSTSYSVTSGLLMLVTVGSGSHAIFDRFVWTLSACGCCRSGGRFGNCGCLGGFCKTLAFSLAIILVVTAVALATCAVVVRATVEESGQLNKIPFFENNNLSSENRTEVSMQESLELNDILDEFDVTDYSFLRGYALEFVVSLFVYYPFIETVLFSGMLGCGCIPILGGRPLSMKKELLKQSDGRCVCPSDLADEKDARV